MSIYVFVSKFSVHLFLLRSLTYYRDHSGIHLHSTLITDRLSFVMFETFLHRKNILVSFELEGFFVIFTSFLTLRSDLQRSHLSFTSS